MQATDCYKYDNHNVYRGTRVFKTDIYETKEGYTIEVELPGYKRENINLDYNKGYLTITAKKEEENREYIRKETFTGEAYRTFYLGEDVDSEKIIAKLENGVLSINLFNKTKEEIKRKIVIE